MFHPERHNVVKLLKYHVFTAFTSNNKLSICLQRIWSDCACFSRNPKTHTAKIFMSPIGLRDQIFWVNWPFKIQLKHLFLYILQYQLVSFSFFFKCDFQSNCGRMAKVCLGLCLMKWALNSAPHKPFTDFTDTSSNMFLQPGLINKASHFTKCIEHPPCI